MSQPLQNADAQALQDLLKAGLTSKKIALDCLKNWNLSELATFTINLDLSSERRALWLVHLDLPKEKREEAFAAFHTALDSHVAEEMEQVFLEQNISEEQIIGSLSQLAADLPPADVIDLFFDHDFNHYEILCAVRDGQNRASRLQELHNLDNVCQDPHSLFETYCSAFALADQLTILHLLDLKADALTLFSQALGIFPNSLRDFSPKILQRKINPVEIKKILPILLKGTSKETLRRILESRENARARWFQTVGPNVDSVFGGVLSKPAPCLPGTYGIAKIPGVKHLQFPDFEMVLFADNSVRARQIGKDGLLSTEEETHTIYHFYEGALCDTQIALQECSAYPADPKRPTLGPLTFQNVTIAETGLGTNFRWKGKEISLKWSPGF